MKAPARLLSDRNEPLIYTSTAARVAAEMGVSESYVKRAAKYARGVDSAEEAVPGAKNEILSGKLKATDAEIIALAQLSKEEIHAALDELRKPKSERPPKNRLQKVETASSCRTIFMTSALKEELKKWLNQLAADEIKDPARYHDSGMLFRLPNGLAVEPVLIRKKFLK